MVDPPIKMHSDGLGRGSGSEASDQFETSKDLLVPQPDSKGGKTRSLEALK